MRDYWTDHNGKQWKCIESPRRLKFKYPLHAALRAFVFYRDGFKCCRCSAKAINVPAVYDGKEALFTDTFIKSGYRDMLILDHVLTLNAGGRSHPSNSQTLCETCNKRKIKEDNKATAEYRRGAAK